MVSSENILIDKRFMIRWNGVKDERIIYNFRLVTNDNDLRKFEETLDSNVAPS